MNTAERLIAFVRRLDPSMPLDGQWSADPEAKSLIWPLLQLDDPKDFEEFRASLIGRIGAAYEHR